MVRIVAVQRFSENLVEEWLGLLRDSDVRELYQAVLRPQSSGSQLKAVRKVGSALEQGQGSESDYDVCLQVLVEVHSCCSSRHPLQRAISSVLVKVELEPLERLLAVNLRKILQNQLSAAPDKETEEDSVPCDRGSKLDFLGISRSMQYMESLLENFPPGERGLKLQLPLVLRYCAVTVRYCSEVKQNTSTISFLVETIKTTMNILHKFSTGFFAMLVSSQGVSGCPEEWGKMNLREIAQTCELMVLKGDFPHDVTLSATMLLVVVSNILCSTTTDPLHENREFVNRWISHITLKPFPKLALCYALLAKLSTEVLRGVVIGGEPLLLALFPIVCDLFDGFTESGDRYSAARAVALWSSVARDCILSGEDSALSEALSPSNTVVLKLLQYIWSLWEDPIDGIRHQCKEMFENIIKIYRHLEPGSNQFLFTLAGQLLSLDSPTRGKFILLSSLVQYLPIGQLVSAFPSLPSDLLSVMGHQALACHAGELWSKLVRLHWEEERGRDGRMAAWNDLWIPPLLQAMCSGSFAARRHISQHCLPVVFRCSEDSMEYVGLRLEAMKVSPDKVTATKLACLRAAKAECKNFSQSSLESIDDIFRSSIYHSEEQISLSGLSLVCESVKTTDAPPPSHLRRLLEFIAVNGNSQSPGFRDPALGALKKVLNRIVESAYSLMKLHHKRCGSELPHEGCDSDPSLLIKSYKEFLRDLLNQQFGVLHPLSSFQRRNFSLSILQLLAACFRSPLALPHGNSGSAEDGAGIPAVFVFSAAVSEQQGACLREGLCDPFDANRALCLDLLSELPVEKLGLASRGVKCCVADYLSLVCQPKSVSCSSAAYLLKFMVKAACTDFNYHLAMHLEEESLLHHPGEDASHLAPHPCEDSPQHSLVTVNLLCSLLHKHITTAKADLVRASMTAPMYGVVQSICAVLETRAAASSVDEIWGPVFGRLVELCQCLSDLVSPVVCSSSPEGFLPEGDGGTGVATQAHCPSALNEAFEITQRDGAVHSSSKGGGVPSAVYGSSVVSGESDTVQSSSVGIGSPRMATEIHGLSVGSATSGVSAVVHNSSMGGGGEVDRTSSVGGGGSGVPAVHGSSAGGAQSLLLCCWHTMKEVSLLLGHLVEHSSIAVGAGVMKELLTPHQMGAIADIFIHQLTEARHRGAFEMAYTGFSKLCRSLWSSPDPELNQRPQSWVRELLESLQSTSVAKLLTVTRRSAGLPFFLQAILATEPALSGKECLKSTLEVLLKVAREAVTSHDPAHGSSPNPSDATAELVTTEPAAVHALNILRALFRDSRLAEHVVTFVPEAVEVAITGFSARLWPVRNSSNLLFTSLMLRVFGAKRVADEHSMENKTTGREFFTRFPGLHGYLLRQLQQNTEILGEGKDTRGDLLQPSLFPVLLILSRLSPSPLDDADSPMSLKPFIPLLMRCTCCSLWKTRVLVARALSLMLTEHDCVTVLTNLYDRMTLSAQNLLHGCLLVVNMVIQDRGKLLTGCEYEGKPVSVLLLHLHLLKWQFGSNKNPCVITRSLYLEVLNGLLEHYLTPSVLQALGETSSLQLHSFCLQSLAVCRSILSHQDRGVTCDEAIVLQHVRLLRKLSPHFLMTPPAAGSSNCAEEPPTSEGSSNSPRAEEPTTCSDGSHHAKKTSDIPHEEGTTGIPHTKEPPRTPHGGEARNISSGPSSKDAFNEENIFESFVGVLSCCRSGALMSSTLDSLSQWGRRKEGVAKEAIERVVEVLVGRAKRESHPDVLTHIYAYISKGDRLSHDPNLLAELVAEAEQLFQRACIRIELRVSLVQFLTASLPLLQSQDTAIRHLTALFGFLEKLSVPTHPYQIREAIASSLLKLWPLVLLSGHDDIAKCCRLVLGLLQDSDGDVRREMAAAVSELLAGVNGLPVVGSLSPASALKFFISSLPRLFPHPKTCWHLLLSLLPQTSSETPPLPANPLFDEDPVNDYAEELVSMQHLVEGARGVLMKLQESGSVSQHHYNGLMGHLKLPRSTDPGLVRSRWGDVSTALNARKVQLLSPLVTLVREEMGVECDTSTLVELTEDIHIAIATN